MEGVVVNVAPSILYSIVNSERGATVGKLKADSQVLEGAINTGIAGKTTAFVVPSWQAGLSLIEFAGIEPHALVNLYRALIVQHPGVFKSNKSAEAIVPYALNVPPGACTAYSAVNPNADRSGTGMIPDKGASQTLAGGVKTGADGKITAFTVLLEPHNPVPEVLAAVDPHIASITYRAVIV